MLNECIRTSKSFSFGTNYMYTFFFISSPSSFLNFDHLIICQELSYLPPGDALAPKNSMDVIFFFYEINKMDCYVSPIIHTFGSFKKLSVLISSFPYRLHLPAVAY